MYRHTDEPTVKYLYTFCQFKPNHDSRISWQRPGQADQHKVNVQLNLFEPHECTIQVYKPKEFSGLFACDYLLLGFSATCLDDDLNSIFHRVLEGHLDSKQAVFIGR